MTELEEGESQEKSEVGAIDPPAQLTGLEAGVVTDMTGDGLDGQAGGGQHLLLHRVLHLRLVEIPKEVVSKNRKQEQEQ